MLNISGGQIVPRFIVWDNRMLKINEIKNDIENFWSIYVLKSVSFHFLHFRGHQTAQKTCWWQKTWWQKNWWCSVIRNFSIRSLTVCLAETYSLEPVIACFCRFWSLIFIKYSVHNLSSSESTLTQEFLKLELTIDLSTRIAIPRSRVPICISDRQQSIV